MNNMPNTTRQYHRATEQRFARRASPVQRRILWAIFLIGPLLPAAARAKDLIPLLPRDTLVAVSVTDVPGLVKAWQLTPLGKAAKDPRIAGILEPLERRLKKAPGKIGERWGLSTGEIESVLTGGAVVFLTQYSWPTPEVYEFDLCFLAEIRPENRERVRAVVEKLLEKTPVDAQRSRFLFKDETVYLIQYTVRLPKAPPALDRRTGRTVVETPAPGSALSLVEEIPIVIQYAFVGNYLIVCEGRQEPVRKIITALKDPAERLDQDAGYRRIVEKLEPEGALTGWIAAGRTWRIFTDHLKQKNKDAPDLSTLGLQDVGGAMARIGLAPDAVTADLAIELPKAPKGILGMLVQPGRPNDLRTASLCPPDVLSYSTILIDWGRLWSVIRSIMTQFAPQAWAFLNMQISQFNREFGIDMERGVIGAMGGETAFYRRRPPSLQGRPGEEEEFGSVTFLIGLRDGKTFRQNHERLFQSLTAEPYQLPLVKSTYLSYDIFQFKQEPGEEMPTVPAWTVTDGFLIISTDSEEIPGILRAWAGKAEKTLADDERFKDAVAEFPAAGRIGFSYTPASSLPDIVTPFLYMVSFSRYGREEASGFPSPEKLEDPAIRQALTRYIQSMSGASYIEPGVFHTHSRISAVKR